MGVIGLGIMGGAFAANILNAGFPLVGHDVDDARLNIFYDSGGIALESACEVARRADIVITSLPTVKSFHDVMTGDNGIIESSRRGLVVVECSTLSLDDKLSAKNSLQQAGITLLDCPISGTGSQAITRDLSVYISGDKEASGRCQGVFDSIANHSFYVGEFGNGSKMKFVANVLVAVHNVASAEAMTLGLKAGLAPETVFDVIKAGAGNSRIFELRAPMMVDNDYSNATMKMDVWQKDLAVIDGFAQDLEIPLPLFCESTKIYRMGMDMGFDKLDTASVCRVLEKMAAINR